MDVPERSANGCSENSDVEEEFCSCCGEEVGWQVTDETEELDRDLDESSLRMFFKGVSVCQAETSHSGLSGIGVVMERSAGIPLLQVQKKLYFHVEDSLAEMLALMDGLLAACHSGVRRVFAFTDSQAVHNQIAEGKEPVDQLMTALGERILEHADKLEVFALKLVPSSRLKKSLLLAQEAISTLSSSSPNADESILSEPIYCPFPNCSILLGPRRVLHGSECSQPAPNMVECPECRRLICVACVVPWHVSVSCEEFQNLSEGRSAEDAILHGVTHDNNWRLCGQCRQMIECTPGCYLVTCWCGHELCYSCGAECMAGQLTCRCGHQDEENLESSPAHSDHNSELWRWESFELPTSTMDAYTEQERSQLALIQRFLAGGSGLGDQNTYHSPPRCLDSLVDTMKDLHQLPWLERFVSLISDYNHEDYIQ